MLIYFQFFTFIFALILNYLAAQYTEDCYNYNTNGKWACYVSPEGCTNLNCKFIVKWKNEINYVDFQLISHIDLTVRSTSQVFSALGFSNDKLMGNDSVCMCRTINDTLMSVETYFNDLKQNSDVLIPTNRSVGVFNISVKLIGSYLMCNFSRLKSISNLDKFYNISNSYYLLVTSGKTNSLGSPVWDLQKTYASSSQFSFQMIKSISGSGNSANESNKTAVYTYVYPQDLIAKTKAHGCIMVFAWMLIASTGILVSRYYKYLWHSKIICYSRFFLSAHRALMVSVFALSMIAFLIMLSVTNWSWPTPSQSEIGYAHSIFGIITVSLAFTQSFIGFFYTSVPMSYSKRKIFHYTHRSVGTSTYFFAIVSIYLAVNIPEMRLGRIGWGIVCGWTIWSLVLPLTIEIMTEIIESCHKEKTFKIDINNPKRDEIIADNLKSYRNTFNKIKSVFLAFHLIVSVSLSIALVVVISISDSNDFVNI